MWINSVCESNSIDDTIERILKSMLYGAIGLQLFWTLLTTHNNSNEKSWIKNIFTWHYWQQIRWWQTAAVAVAAAAPTAIIQWSAIFSTSWIWGNQWWVWINRRHLNYHKHWSLIQRRKKANHKRPLPIPTIFVRHFSIYFSPFIINDKEKKSRRK